MGEDDNTDLTEYERNSSDVTSGRAGPETDQPTFVVTAPTLPKGGGAISPTNETFSTNPATGAGGLSIPIPIAATRSDLVAVSSLNYNSGHGNGAYGFGWAIDVPAVSRSTTKGIPQYSDTADIFTLSGADDLVPDVNSEVIRSLSILIASEYKRQKFTVKKYRPRIQQNHSKIERWTNIDTHEVHFRVTTQSNVTSVFGLSENARVFESDNPNRVFKWLLQEAFDDRGNIIKYTYKNEDLSSLDRNEAAKYGGNDPGGSAQKYLKEVLYGNSTPFPSGLLRDLGNEDLLSAWENSNRWYFSTVFDYGDHNLVSPQIEPDLEWPTRIDSFSTHRAGFEIRTRRRCERILLFHNINDRVDPKLIKSLDLSYQNDATGSRLEAIQLHTHLDGSSESFPALKLSYSEANFATTLNLARADEKPIHFDDRTSQFVDLFGEGLNGILSANEQQWLYQHNLGGGAFSIPKVLSQLPSLNSGPIQFADIDGDGRVELLAGGQPASGFYRQALDENWIQYRPAKGNPNIDRSNNAARYIDLTGNGRADILLTEDLCLRWYNSEGEDGYSEGICNAFDAEENGLPRIVFSETTQTIFLGDMTGDGLSDIIRLRNGSIEYRLLAKCWLWPIWPPDSDG